MTARTPAPLLRWINRLLWWTLASITMLLAIYVSLGRYAAGLLAQHQHNVIAYLNARLPVQLEVRQLAGEWQHFTPSLLLSGVRLDSPEPAPSSPLQIDFVRVSVDVLASLRSRSLQLSHLELEQMQLILQEGTDGGWGMPGLAVSEDGSLSAFWNFVMSTRIIRLRDGRVQLRTNQAGEFPLELDLALERSGDFRRLQAVALTEGHRDQLELIAELRGDPMRPQQLRSDAFLRTHVADVSRYQVLLPPLHVDAAAGELQLESHLSWDGAQALFAGSLQATDLRWQEQAEQSPLDLQALAMTVQGRWQQAGWQLDLAQLQLTQSQRSGNLARAQLIQGPEGLTIRLQEGDVAPFADVLRAAGVLPEVARNALSQLQPEGHIPSAEFRWQPNAENAAWSLRSRFRDLAVDSWNNAPGVRGADGFLELGPGVGRVYLESEQLALALPKVFSTDLRYEYVAGVLDLGWGGEGFALRSGILRTRGAEGQAVGLLRLDIPRPDSGRIPEMDLLLGLTSSTPQHRYKYLPLVLPDRLLSWLDGAFDEGRIRSGGFLWRGSLRPGDAPLRTVQLFFDVEQMVLNYHPSWPTLRDARGLAFINDAQVSVWLQQGSIYDATVREVSAELNAAPGALGLTIAGQLELGGEDLSRLLKETPLRARLPALADWEITGQAVGRLNLAMDLKNLPASLDVTTQLQLREAALNLPALSLEVSSLAGDIAYSTAYGLSAQQLQGSLWGEAVTATIGSVPDAPGGPVTNISLQGVVAPQRAMKHFQLPLADRLQGSTDVTADIRVAGSRSTLELRSNLAGVAVDLPAPWGKAAEQTQSLAMIIPLERGAADWRLELEQLLDLRWDPVRRVAAAGLGGVPLVLPEQGLLISGGLSSLDLPATLALLGELPSADGPKASPAGEPWPVSVDGLVIDHLLLVETDLGPVVLDLEFDELWRAGVYADWFRLEGQIAPDFSRGELRFDDLDLAAWDRRKAAPGEDAEVEPTEAAGEATQWPQLAVEIVQLRRDQDLLGRLQFDYQRSQDRHRVEQLRGQYRGLRFSAEAPAELRWRGRGAAAETALKARLEFDDIGKVLQDFAYVPIVSSRAGQLDVDLRWSGGPTAFTLPAASGGVQLAMRGGSFQRASAATAGALRVVGILNLAEMVVRLDPSRPFQSGIPFESMQAELTLGDGQLRVAALDVNGPGSRFQLAGVADLLERTQTGELIATLPINNNLPWVAALAGGLPAAAGLFVFTRVFEKQIQQATSLRYRIGGTWDEPELQLDGLFANPSPPAVSHAEEAEAEQPDEGKRPR